MAVPYKFANVNSSQGIPLEWLDADFDYLSSFLNSSAKVVDNIADLASLSPLDYEFVYIKGYYSPGDGGEGYFYSSNSGIIGTYSSNGGTIVVPTGGNGSSAWLRIYNSSLNVKWFGAIGDGSTNDTTAIQNAINVGPSVYVPPGTYSIGKITVTN